MISPLTCCVTLPTHDDLIVQVLAVEQLQLPEIVEQWRPVPEAPLYDVSTWGRVRRRNNDHHDDDDEYFDVASWPNAKGYYLVSIELPDGMPRLRYVHRLVLAAFRGVDPARRICNHDDGHKGHNTLDNLEWTTPAGNVAHAWATGLISRARRFRETCRHGHPRDQVYHQRGRTWRRCSRCRKVRYRRNLAEKAGLRSLLALLD